VFWGCVLTDYAIVEEEGGEVVRGRREEVVRRWVSWQ
jgi:hypothetical protein